MKIDPVKKKGFVEDLEVCRFNKHKDRRWEYVVEDDYDYVLWVMENTDISDEQYEYLMDLVENR